MPEPYLTLAGRPMRHVTGDETADELAAFVQEIHTTGFSCPTSSRSRVRIAVSAALDACEGERRFKVHTMASPVPGICSVYVEYHPDADPDWLEQRHLAAVERMRQL